MKLCFISYARNNNLDGRLTKFIEKLSEQLPQHLPHGTKLDDVTFFDVKSIESGEQWMERLAEATRRCKLCVCFYSPPYFTSEYSGREVQVFLLRLKEWQKQPTNAGKQARAIVPVIWVPAKPPLALTPFQYKDDDFPTLYLTEGLLALAMRKSRADAYNAVLNELAKRIAATVAAVNLPDGPPIAHFGPCIERVSRARVADSLWRRTAVFSATPNGLEKEVEQLSQTLRSAGMTDAGRAAQSDSDDPHRNRFGGKKVRAGFAVKAKVNTISDDFFEVLLTVYRQDGKLLTGEVEFHLHPTFSPAVRRVPAQDGEAQLRLEAWGAFTVGVVILDTLTQLEIDLAKERAAPGAFRMR